MCVQEIVGSFNSGYLIVVADPESKGDIEDIMRTLEFARGLQIISVQPVGTIIQQLPPNVIASSDWPPRGIPEPCFDTPGVSIVDKSRNDITLCVADSREPAPPNRGAIVGACNRRKCRIPCRIQRRVIQLRKRCVEKVVARLQCFDSVKW